MLGLNEMAGRLFELSNPLGKEFRTIKSCRKHDELSFFGKKNHRLLPHFSTVPVIDIMALVKDDRTETL